eukprot:6800079-Prymnesium_polylepis.2
MVSKGAVPAGAMAVAFPVSLSQSADARSPEASATDTGTPAVMWTISSVASKVDGVTESDCCGTGGFGGGVGGGDSGEGCGGGGGRGRVCTSPWPA